MRQFTHSLVPVKCVYVIFLSIAEAAAASATWRYGVSTRDCLLNRANFHHATSDITYALPESSI